MNSRADFTKQFKTTTQDTINNLAKGVLDLNNNVIRRGWFILGYSSHSPYWINAFDLCRHFHRNILDVAKETMEADRSLFQAIPWSHETASYSFYLSGIVDNCFDFRVGLDEYYEKQLEHIVDKLNISRVTIVGDLAVMGTLYYNAVEMLQKANVTIARVLVAISRPNPILIENMNRIEKRRIPWISLLEFFPADDGQSWILKDIFGNEQGRLPTKFYSHDERGIS